MRASIVRMGVVILLLLATTSGRAAIYVHEDFEEAQIFVDRDYPVKGEATVPTPQIVAVRGMNLRSYDDTPERTVPKAGVATTGQVTQSRFFEGSRSLQLDAGQTLGSSVFPYVSSGSGPAGRFIQFAVSASEATGQLPPGTEVGFFKQDWSLTDTVSREASLELALRVTAAGRIEVFCENTASVAGEFGAGVGEWAVISVMAYDRREEGHADTQPNEYDEFWQDGFFHMRWSAFDPLTNTYKGPQTGQEPDTFPVLPTGIYVFVNSDSLDEAVYVHPDQMGPHWGQDAADGGNSGGLNMSRLIGWDFGALNGATLFVDHLYWDAAYHERWEVGWTQEGAARMLAFDAFNQEVAPPNASRHWHVMP